MKQRFVKSDSFNIEVFELGIYYFSTSIFLQKKSHILRQLIVCIIVFIYNKNIAFVFCICYNQASSLPKLVFSFGKYKNLLSALVMA